MTTRFHVRRCVALLLQLNETSPTNLTENLKKSRDPVTRVTNRKRKKKCQRKKTRKGRDGSICKEGSMADYDGNPFADPDVNPFAVSGERLV